MVIRTVAKFHCLLRHHHPDRLVLLKNRSFTFTQSLNTTNKNANGANNDTNSPITGANANIREIGWNGTKIDTSFLARQFINTLDVNERRVIKDELIKAEAEMQSQLATDGKKVMVAKPSWKQLLMVGFQTGLPFIGFGFVDNFLMIVAGDIIEAYIGIFLPISTMAAAGLGNGISDVAGIGLSHHIEFYCSRFIGEMKLTPEQFNLRIVNWVIIIAKSLCIFVGCVIGMAPLLFINHSKSETKKTSSEDTDKSTNNDINKSTEKSKNVTS